MAAASMEAVIKKMPMEWGQIIGSGQFKRRIGDDEQMSSLFKSVAENKEVLKRPFKATAKKAKKTPEEKKLKRKSRMPGKSMGYCSILGLGLESPSRP